MARKSKQSVFEDMIGIAAMLPWWVGVLLSVIAYFILHHYATVEVAPAASVAQLGANAGSQLGKVLASFAQYLLPLAFIIGAGISAFGQKKRSRLIADVQEGSNASVLNGMSWQEFEMLVGEAFRRGGYSVTEAGGGGADGGIDLVLHKNGAKSLVQCKQWKARNVGVSVVRELNGVMAATGAAQGFVVTSGVFSPDAKDFAARCNIELIDGVELKQIINRVQPVGVQEKKILSMTGQLCPKCGSSMVMRTAKQGANAGKPFWGCSSYPQCRGIVAID